MHGVHVISPLPAPPADFAARFLARRGRAPDREAYAGYLTGRLVLDLIDRAGRNGRAAIREGALEDPRFGAGRLAPSIYRVEQGKLEFVEEAP